MNILTLFKRLWALFVFASMLLALIAKPFLVLISFFLSGSDEDTNCVPDIGEEGRAAWSTPGDPTAHFNKPDKPSIAFTYFD